MKILKLSMIDLIRRPGKNMMLAAAIVMAVALLTSLSIVSTSANTAILEVISKTGHTLTVRPVITKRDEDDITSETLTTSEVVLGKYIPEAIIPKIQKGYDKAIRAGWEKKGGLVIRPGIGEINLEPPTWAPRLYGRADLDGSRVIVTGVDFYKEYFVRFWWKLASGEWPTDATRIRKAGDDEAFIGGALARARKLGDGNTVKVRGRTFKIMGVLEETNSADDYMLFIPLVAAQEIFDRKSYVSLLSVRAMCPNCPVGDAMVELNKTITGITATSQLDIAGVQFKFFNMLYRFLFAVVAATILVAVLSIFNMVTGSLYARTREIGLLKSIGASRCQVLRIFLYEHFILGLAAGGAGYLLGILMAMGLNAFLDIGAMIRIEHHLTWRALFLGIICSIAAIFLPALKLTRIKITETFRTQWET